MKGKSAIKAVTIALAIAGGCALANPSVQVTLDGQTRSYTAVPIEGEEHARVNAAHALPFAFRVLTGFPPRLLLRLDPAAAPNSR